MRFFYNSNTMSRILIVFCFLAFISCKMDTKEDKSTAIDENVSERKNLEGNDFFQLEMDAVILKNDKFELFYKEYNDEEFSEERVITVTVNGSSDTQKLVFDLPAGILPNELRLDVGEDPNQEAISLNSLKIGFDQKEYLINSAKFVEVFEPNKYVIYNETDQKILTKKMDDVYDPFFIANDLDPIVYHLMN